MNIEKPRSQEDIASHESVKLNEAREIFGKDFLGPEAVKDTFKIEVGEIPDIPFSKEDLERAKELNQQLILYTNKAPDGEPLTIEKIVKLTENKTSDGKRNLFNNHKVFEWYKKENFFVKETPKAEWKLVNQEQFSVGEGTYLTQTTKMVDYLKNKVFKNKNIPENFQKAIEEYEAKKKNIERLYYYSSDLKKAEEELENLQITKICRETAIETIYRLVLNDKINNNRLLEDSYSWTRSRSSDGNFIKVGGFSYDHITGHDGIEMSKETLDDTGDYLHNSRGVYVSRNF